MKRYLFLILLSMSIVVLLSVESDPSATVGYFKIGTLSEGTIVPISPGSWTPVSVPFGLTLEGCYAVFGNQLAYEDLVVDPYSGFGATYYGEYGWFYDQDDSLMMQPGHFYWVKRADANPSFNYFLLGTVDPQGFTLTMTGNGGWTPFALNEASPVSVYSLGIPNLVADDLNGLYDQIVDVTDGTGATYYGAEYGWYDTEANNDYFISPTHGYYFNSYYGSNYSWTYTPGARRLQPAGSLLLPNKTRSTR